MCHAARPFALDIHTLSRQAGTIRHVERQVETTQAWDDVLIGLPAHSLVDLVCDLEAVGHGVLVTGLARYRLTGQCARCLTPLQRLAEVGFQELFVYLPSPGARDRPGRTEQAEDWPRTDGEIIDLEAVVRDAVVLDLPWTPLCEDDCAGLCVECGANLNRDPGHSHAEPIDARWGGLASWVPSGKTGPGDRVGR
jgi:uncharacterized protein